MASPGDKIFWPTSIEIPNTIDNSLARLHSELRKAMELDPERYAIKRTWWQRFIVKTI